MSRYTFASVRRYGLRADLSRFSDTFRARPLFYGALFYCAALFVWNAVSPPRVPAADVSFHAPSNGVIRLAGKVVSTPDERRTPYGEKRVSFLLDCRKIENGAEVSTVSGRTKVHLREPSQVPRFGDEAIVEGELLLPDGKRNPGGFDQRAYLARSGTHSVLGGAKGAPIRVRRRPTGWREAAERVKTKLAFALDTGFGPSEAAFLKALLLGVRSGLGDDFKDLFLKTGTTHILAVSGFNVGFLIFLISALLRFIRTPRNFSLVVCLAAVWVYSFVVGWQAPVVRAAVMASVFLLGKLLGRKPDILNSLGLAAILVLAVRPQDLIDAGFQLSFLAVFGIAVFMPQFQRPAGSAAAWARPVEELFWVSFIAFLVTLPVTLETFHILTPFSLLANMAAVPLSFFLFASGLAYLALFAWVPAPLDALALAVKGLLTLEVRVLEGIERLPGAYWNVGDLPPFFALFIGVGAALLLVFFRKGPRFARAAIALFFVASALLAHDLFRVMNRSFSVTFLDVGQGDAIYAEFKDGGNLLIDAGRGGTHDAGKWVITPFLRSRGVSTIDVLLESHPQEDHIGGMPSVLEEFHVRSFVSSGKKGDSATARRLSDALIEERSEHLKPRTGDRLEGFRGVDVEFLNPDADQLLKKDLNDSSLVLRVRHGGWDFLFTGDIGSAAMERLTREAPEKLECTVLKVPHHGSKMKEGGEVFLAAAAPKASVVSVGRKNLYGHPAPSTLSLLKDLPGHRVFRTDKDGAVTVHEDHGRLRVATLQGSAYDLR